MKEREFDWNKAKAFFHTVTEGSYTKAADKLGVAQTTLARQVASLEDELGLVLLEKLGKKLKLTPSGEQIFEYVKELNSNADKMVLLADGLSNKIDGSVSISVSEAYACFLIPKILKKLKSVHPNISIDLIVTNESSDLAKREADIAIRNYRPKGDSLIAKKICDSSYGLYASKEYLAENPIDKLDDFSDKSFIGFPGNELVIKELSNYGIKVDDSNFGLISNSHLSHWQHVLIGFGIGFMTVPIAKKDPSVVHLLPHLFKGMGVENWLVTHRELKTNKRIRVVYDFLYEEVKKALEG